MPDGSMETSGKQRARIHVDRARVEGLAATKRAAAMLGLTTRRARRSKAEFKLHGEVVAIHGNSRRPSPKRLAEETRRRYRHNVNSVFKCLVFNRILTVRDILAMVAATKKVTPIH